MIMKFKILIIMKFLKFHFLILILRSYHQELEFALLRIRIKDFAYHALALLSQMSLS